jgi:hypothetical protein
MLPISINMNDSERSKEGVILIPEETGQEYQLRPIPIQQNDFFHNNLLSYKGETIHRTARPLNKTGHGESYRG